MRAVARHCFLMFPPLLHCRRLQVKKDLQLKLAAGKEKPGSGEEAESDAASESSLDEEGKILEEMDDVRSKAASRLKKERKKRRESKNKARIRAAQLALSESRRHAKVPSPAGYSYVITCILSCSSCSILVSKEVQGDPQAVKLGLFTCQHLLAVVLAHTAAVDSLAASVHTQVIG